jgi:anthranilate synthase/aminodeoxychorismate synthase-like glutamine amidotransferase
MLLIIDNYDSFTYNIFHYIDCPENEIMIVRNDKVCVDEIDESVVNGIIISPGPMSPCEAGFSNEIIRKYSGKIPILGICLGHQCIGQVFGCEITSYEKPVHGQKSRVQFLESELYTGIGKFNDVGRYHSLIIDKNKFNDEDLVVNAISSDGIIMGIEHKEHKTFGVQFHPESLLSGETGKKILKNYVNLLRRSINAKGLSNH